MMKSFREIPVIKSCHVLEFYFIFKFYFIFQSFSLTKLFKLFRGLGLRHLIVVNEENEVSCWNYRTEKNNLRHIILSV